jgi:general secretion pathway protein H
MTTFSKTPPADQAAGARRRPGQVQGFALLDLLLAMLVLSLLMLVALPALVPGTSPNRHEAYAAEIAALLISDRAAAAQSGRPTGTSIDVDRRRIAAGGRQRALQLPADLALDVTSSEGCGRQRGAFLISFEADGRSCGAVIRLAKGDRAWRIRVNWLTGYIDVAGPA